MAVNSSKRIESGLKQIRPSPHASKDNEVLERLMQSGLPSGNEGRKKSRLRAKNPAERRYQWLSGAVIGGSSIC